MKVLLLATHLNIGGVAVYTVNLAKGLKAKNIEVSVASSGGELVGLLQESRITHFKIGVKTKCEFNPKLIIAFFKLFAFIRKNNIDVIHAQTRVAQVLGFLLSGFSGASYVTTCHGFFKKQRISRRLFGGWGTHVIAISDAVREHLVKDFKVSAGSVSLIYNGVDSEAFSRKIAEDVKGNLRSRIGFDRSPIIGSVSRLSPVKGQRYLLFAMKDILKEMPEARLLLVGEGPSKEYLMELAKKLGIESDVFFAKSTTETARFLSIIDVFVFYSLEEGLGLSLLEAMAAGKPCVASDVGGVSSIVEDNVTGILVPPKDPHVLKEAIIKVLKDKGLKLKLARNAQALVKDKFSLDKMINGVIDVYQKALQK